jgi:hypothetical protein
MTSASYRMERAFLKQVFILVNEIQGNTKLPSQANSNRKSTWFKQVSNRRQKSDALTRIK